MEHLAGVAWRKRDGQMLWTCLESGTVLLAVLAEPHDACKVALYRHEWTPEEWAALVMGLAAGEDNEPDFKMILALHLGFEPDASIDVTEKEE